MSLMHFGVSRRPAHRDEDEYRRSTCGVKAEASPAVRVLLFLMPVSGRRERPGDGKPSRQCRWGERCIRGSANSVVEYVWA